MSLPSTRSDFNVEVVRITSVDVHPNADRLSVYQSTSGYPVVDRKDVYKVGDLAVYIPVDAIVPVGNPAFAFLKKKEGQETARIGAVRLRGIYSEGLLVPVTIIALDDSGIVWPRLEGQNVQELLGITKYESPVDFREGAEPRTKKSGAASNPRTMPVYGLDSLVRFKDAIKPRTHVIITEKIHGCNARYRFEDGRLYVGSHKVMRGDTGSPLKSWLVNTWREVKHLFFSSNRGGNLSALQEKGDIWWTIAEQYKLKERLSKYPGLTFYGEIYGAGLQKRGGADFCYDSPNGLKFRVFDIYDSENSRYLSDVQMCEILITLGMSTAPELYSGPWLGLEETDKLIREVNGTYSNLSMTLIREGWVVRTDVNEPDVARICLKYVSPEYKLLGEG